MSRIYTQIVPDSRLIDLIKGYVSGHSTEISRPDMNSELHLLELAKLVVYEAHARLPLWRLEHEANKVQHLPSDDTEGGGL